MLEIISKIIKKPERVFFHLKQKFFYIKSIDLKLYKKSIESFRIFKAHEVKRPTALLIEFNNFHAEILPGYTHYLNKLGYDVIILMLDNNFELNPFCRFKEEVKPRILVMSPKFIRKTLKLDQIKNYELLVITSLTFVEPYGFWGTVPKYLKFLPKAKRETIYIEHDVNDVDFTTSYINQVFTLFPKVYKSHNFSMINPHYFGDVQITGLNKTKIFITVGALNDRNRTSSGLIQAIENIVKEGITDFKIWVIGKVSEEQINRNNLNQIEYLGYLNFEQLYQRMEMADFYLPLLDKDNRENLRYINGQTTGSLQLILGFGKVPVIQDEFANHYGLSTENAIIQTGTLEESLREALNIEEDGYRSKQKALLQLSTEIFNSSLLNLKNTIH